MLSNTLWRRFLNSLITRTQRSRCRRRPMAAAHACLETLETRTLLSAGTLDPSFGGDGTITTDVAIPTWYDDGRDVVAYQSDGKSIVVGTAAGDVGASQTDIAIVRYNTDGSLDTTFGNNGIVKIDFGSTPDGGQSVAIDSFGRILVAGYSIQGGTTGTDFAVARLTADGNLDTGFAVDGRQTVDFGDTYDFAYGVAVDTTNRVLVGGYSDQGGSANRDFAVARLTADGQLDASFDGDGRQTVDFGSTFDNGTSIAVDSVDRILVAGDTYQGGSTGYDFSVARLTTSGSLDSEFDSDGRQTVSFGTTAERVYSVAVDSIDRVLVAGYANQSGTKGIDFAVARLTSIGILDLDFDGDGRQTVDFGNTYDVVQSVTVDSTNRVLLAGRSDQSGISGYDFAVARLAANGSLDGAFDGDGRKTVDFGGTHDTGYSVAVDDTDRVLVGGHSFQGGSTGTDFAMVRLTTSGGLDESFSFDGKVLTDVGRPGSSNGREIVAYQTDGRSIVVGSSHGDMVAVRYNSDGSLDTTFGNHGIVKIDFGNGNDFGLSVAIDNLGRVLVVGYSVQSGSTGLDIAVARLTVDGHLDTSFDFDGLQTVDFGNTADFGYSVAVDNTNRVLVGGYSDQGGSTGRDFAVVRLTAVGELDTSFDGDGRQTVDFATNDNGYSIDIDSADRILVAGTSFLGGSTGYDFAVARLTTSGSLDSEFDSDGRQTVDFEFYDIGYSVAIDSTDRVLVGGLSNQSGSTGYDFAVARLTLNGSLDADFDSDGRQTIDFGNTNDTGYSVVVDSADRVLVGGVTQQGGSTGNDFAVARLTSNGQLDFSFDGDGRQTVDFGSSNDTGYSVAVGPGNRILLAGSTDQPTFGDLAVARLLSNESPVADAGTAYSLDEGSSLTLDASASTDADSDITAYSWDLDNDGEYDDASSVAPWLTWSALVAAGMSDDGTYTIGLRVEDATGAADTSTATITINNIAPTIENAVFEIVENSVNGTVVGTVTGTDPGDDTLTYSITGGTGGTAFAIDPSTGEITVADASQLDFETDQVFDLEVTVTDDDGATEKSTVTINLLNLASLTGAVFVDVDQDGMYDANEIGIDGVTVELLDEQGNVVATAVTSDGGLYLFEDLAPGTYRIRELHPTGVSDGAEQLGSLGGSVQGNDLMQVTLQRTDGGDYNFAEIGQSVSSGDTATIGFWQNKHGQALIEQGGTALAEWLTENFGHVFGDEFVGADGADVAAFYKDQLFKQKAPKSAGPAKVDAQFMAVAFATFFTSRNLAGDVAADYGFNVTDTGIGTKIVNVGSSGAAFGVADNTDRTILQLLLATNDLTDEPDQQTGFASIYDQDGDGVIDSWEAALRSMANDIFSLINAEGDI